jgi:hypothetical protein
MSACNVSKIEGAVLAVEKDEIETRRAEQARDLGTAELLDGAAENHFPLLEALLCAIGPHAMLPDSLRRNESHIIIGKSP